MDDDLTLPTTRRVRSVVSRHNPFLQDRQMDRFVRAIDILAYALAFSVVVRTVSDVLLDWFR